METLTKRSTKGSALTHAEMDANWDKITNGVLAVETQLAVSLNPDGTIKDEKVPYAATTNGTDNFAVSIPGTYASLSDLAGRIIMVQVDTPNTGAATLTINGTLSDNILKQGGQPLVSGDIKAGVNAFMWDSTTAAFLIVNPTGSNSRVNYGVTTNVGNDFTITIPTLNGSTFEIPEAYYPGYRLLVKLNAGPTGAMRLKVAVTTPAIDLGFADVKKYGTVALDASDLAANQIYEFVYDGSNFQLVGQTNSEALRRFTATSIPIPTASGGRLAAPLAHGLGGVPNLLTWAFVNKSNTSGVAHGYAVGDRVAITVSTDNANTIVRFHPLSTATHLDMICMPAGQLWKKDGSALIAITATQFAADFDLEVSAVRFSI